MSEIEGIKDFIEANKESLENMNKEMIARCSQVPLVYLTLDEAKALLRRIPMFQMSADWMHPIEILKAKIEQAEDK